MQSTLACASLTGHQFNACKFYADHSQYILDSICSCLHFRYNYADKSIQHFVVYSFLHFSYCWIFSIFHIVGVFFHFSYCGILSTFHIVGFCQLFILRDFVAMCFFQFSAKHV